MGQGSSSSSPNQRKSSPRPLSAPRPSKTQDWPVVGDYVEARCLDWSQFYGGVVHGCNPDYTFDVLFDDGERLPNVRFEEIRRPSGLKKQSSAPAFAPGTRVMGKIAGWNNWFPGTVARINGDGSFVVNFDDGDVVSTIRTHELRLEAHALSKDVPTYIKPGSSVECRCDGWHKYYPGVIKSVNLETMECAVMFDDGEFRTDVLVSQIRMARSPSRNAVQFAEDLIAPSKYKIGDRVMANPNDEWSKAYAGRVERVYNDGVTYAILFDDGDRAAGVKESDMSLIQTTRKLSYGPTAEKDTPFRVGVPVEAKVGAWRTFYPGVIDFAHPGDGTFRVRFLDGEVVEKVLATEMRSSRLPTSEAVQRKPSIIANDAVVVNARVLCQLPQWQNSYWGVVSRINPNETYKVDFEDGEIYTAVPLECIIQVENPRLVSSASKSSMGTRYYDAAADDE